MKPPKKNLVVIFIFLKNNKILIEKRLLKKYQGEHYLVPGGRVRELENLEQALIREVKEELGITPLEFVQLPSNKKIQGLEGHILVPFLVKKWQGEFPEVILDRGNSLIWLELDEVLTTPILPTKKIIETLKKYLKENDTN